jgi:glycosyltransferase involved in cell wall biosynthesis
MRSRFYYWRRCLWDFVRYNAFCGSRVSKLLARLAHLRRNSLARLSMLCRAARLCPTRRRLLWLRPALEKEVAEVDVAPAGLGRAGTSGEPRPDLPKGILLKPPVSPVEKGLLYLTFEDHWLRLLQSGQVPAIARRYDLLLGPSSSPPPSPELLLLLRLWPGRLFSLLSNFKDASLLRLLSPKLTPVPLLASHWVDPDAYAPHLDGPKDYDIAMLAHFDPVKRHWLFFEALRKLPRRFRVLLMGVPLGGRTEKDLLAEARTFGVQDRFDLVLRPSRDALMAGLARARTSLIFSRQEGACIAVAESLFADTPVGLFRNARIGSKAFINGRTGVLLRRRGLAEQLQRFVETAQEYRPREWALGHISCHVSRRVLDRVLQQAAHRDEVPWTRNVLPFAENLVPAYLSAEVEAEMMPWYEDFAERYGLLLGPAARRAAATRLASSARVAA